MFCGRVDSYKRRSGGWSVVEILVIAACIALLAGILFPVIMRARRIGYQTKCASNMQQLANAFNAYAQDWDDRWPAPGGLAGDLSYWSQSSPKGGLNPYIKNHGNRSVFCCPLMPDWKSNYPARSYSMNSYLREPADVEYYSCTSIRSGIRVPNISRSNDTILLFEGLPLTIGWEDLGYYVYIYRCCNWTGVKGYYSECKYTIDPAHPWHGKFNNYLYCDGHVEARAPGKYYPPGVSTHKEMYEWYVDKAKFERNWAKGYYRAPYE